MGFLQKTRHSHARPNVPALVQVAALAIIMIRCLDVLMIMNTLGPRGMGEFIHRSAQTWNLTLVFLSSLMLVPGESRREIFHSLVMQKLPDMLVLCLLYLPASSRRFFRLQ